jgi:hypothetical protein
MMTATSGADVGGEIWDEAVVPVSRLELGLAGFALLPVFIPDVPQRSSL